MPQPEALGRNQDAVLWEASGTNDYGEATVKAPVALKVRWESSQRDVNDPQNATVSTDTQVIVDRRIPVHSIMWLGKLADLPQTPTGLHQVVAYQEVPDIKGRYFARSVSLMRFSEKLPALAT